MTASYDKDFARCKLLCETIDQKVSSFTNHYILVESRDVALFSQLAGPRRIIVDERELLPSWLRIFPDPTSWNRRRIWLSLKTKPLRGWHVQQLRRIAIARHLIDDALFYIDSDVAFIRPFDCDSLWKKDRLRLLVRPRALANKDLPEHMIWSANTTKLLGLKDSENALNDYIGTLIGWRRDTIIGMCERIEQQSGMHWVAALGRVRRFSECMLYGRYVDDVLQGTGHFHDAQDLCRVYWVAPPPTEEAFRRFISEMDPQQVAIGIQSFLGMNADTIRRIIDI